MATVVIDVQIRQKNIRNCFLTGLREMFTNVHKERCKLKLWSMYVKLEPITFTANITVGNLKH